MSDKEKTPGADTPDVNLQKAKVLVDKASAASAKAAEASLHAFRAQ